MLKIIILVVSLLTSVSTFAQQLDPFIGLPVRWPTFMNEISYKYGGGFATYDNSGRPVVFISQARHAQVGDLIMGAILQHEYCHHEIPVYPTVALKEASADCCSAGYLAKGGEYGRAALEAIIDLHYSEGCSYNPNIPLDQIPASYPCGIQRARILKQCSGI
jgi:hypothetical protein